MSIGRVFDGGGERTVMLNLYVTPSTQIWQWNQTRRHKKLEYVSFQMSGSKIRQG